MYGGGKSERGYIVWFSNGHKSMPCLIDPSAYNYDAYLRSTINFMRNLLDCETSHEAAFKFENHS